MTRRGPAPTTPRLDALEPVAVAAEACAAVARHRAWIALRLSPALVPADEPDAAALAVGSDLGLTVQHLTAYAQTGALGDWPDDSCALDAVQDVCSCLYSRAGDRAGFDAPDLRDDHDPDTDVGTVIRAAMARQMLSTGTPVPVAWLAALSSVGAVRMRQLVAAGEVPAVDGRVRAPDARRWLSGRRVPGFDAPSGQS